MPVSTQTLEPLDAQTVQYANQILSYLVEASSPQVHATLQGVLNETDLEWNLRQVANLVGRLDTADQVELRAFVGSTTSAITGAGLSASSVTQQALRALKASQRIVQCGKGRGKAIVIMQATPLEAPQEDALPEASVITAMGSHGDFEAFAKIVTDLSDRYRAALDTIDELRSSAMSTQRVAELEAALNSAKEKIESLRQQAQLAKVTTWS